jgi:hypothetical protein
MDVCLSRLSQAAICHYRCIINTTFCVVVDTQVLTHMPCICFLGTLYEGHECVQSIPGVELYFGISKAPTSRHAYQEDYGDARLGNDR